MIISLLVVDVVDVEEERWGLGVKMEGGGGEVFNMTGDCQD